MILFAKAMSSYTLLIYTASLRDHNILLFLLMYNLSLPLSTEWNCFSFFLFWSITLVVATKCIACSSFYQFWWWTFYCGVGLWKQLTWWISWTKRNVHGGLSTLCMQIDWQRKAKLKTSQWWWTLWWVFEKTCCSYLSIHYERVYFHAGQECV